MAILLTGGTGKTSLGIAYLLKDAKIPFVIASRKGQEGVPPGMQGARFEWTDSSTLESALNYKFPGKEKISAVYLVPPKIADLETSMNALVDLAVKKGVKRFVLCTGSSTTQDGRGVGKVWQHFVNLKVDYTILLCTWFMENFLDWQHHASIRNEGKIYSACADGRIPFISASDIAAIAFRTLTDEKPHSGKTYRVLGPMLLTYDQIAAKISQATGRMVQHQNVSEEESAKRFQEFGMPDNVAKFLAKIEVDTANGDEERTGNDVERVIGRPGQTFDAWVEVHKTSWD
ncbi:hypothetical protein BGZ60DRAFT_455250 [Tricladium varicosporioides]|nr:hypothetical protein BGZ60DRAFT_455250 [Hymenoscyphus varicosporioides]